MTAEDFYKRYSIFQSALELLILGLLWLLSLPFVITAGAGTVAMYSVASRCIMGGEGKVVPSFLRSFRSNFRRMILPGTAFMALALLLVLEIRFSNIMGAESLLWKYMSYVYLFLLSALFILTVFTVPALSSATLSTGRALKLGTVLSLKHLFSSFTLFVADVAGIFLISICPILIVIIPPCLSLLTAFISEPFLREVCMEMERG